MPKPLLLSLLLLNSACSSSAEYEPFSSYDHDLGPGQPFEVKELGSRVDRRSRDQNMEVDLFDEGDGGDLSSLEIGVKPDEAIDGGSPSDHGAEDLLDPDADLSGCESAQECLLVVDLETCSPCPRAANRRQLERYPCWVEYEIHNQLLDYEEPSCWESCPETQGFCVQPHFDSFCEHGRCVGAGGVDP